MPATAGLTPAENDDSSVSGLPRRQFILFNKAPLWNENSQVYQLDFGGRVTQESAKNFQVEYAGDQVSSMPSDITCSLWPCQHYPKSLKVWYNEEKEILD